VGSPAASDVGLQLPPQRLRPAEHLQRHVSSDALLLAEVDEDVLQAMWNTLSERRYRVLVARDGAQAMNVLSDNGNVDLLLTDVVMPRGLNGVELARRAKSTTAGIKVLLTSGYAGDVLAKLDAVDEFPILGHTTYLVSHSLGAMPRAVYDRLRDYADLEILQTQSATGLQQALLNLRLTFL